MIEKSKLPQTLLDHTPWETEINPIWIATTFTLRRNLAKHNFPPKLEERSLSQTLTALKDPLLKAEWLESPAFLQAEELTPFDKEYLFEHFLCPESFQNTVKGQAFIVDNTGRFFAALNIQDHLQLQLIDTQGGWEKTWNALNQMETALAQVASFAFSPKFGYLTSDPSHCGTGLTVQAFLHVPALIHTHQLQETLQKQKEEGITMTGMGGSLDAPTGDQIVLTSTHTLGVSEETTVHAIHAAAMKWMALEKGLRAHLQTENNPHIKDQISRAFGLLLHSYQLQAKEALDALSLIKFGLHLDWLEGITEKEITALFFQCQRAHLLHSLGEMQLADPQEIARKRAECLHKHMQSVKLKYEV